MARLKSCPYCGRFHAVDFDCGKKPPSIRRYSPNPTPSDRIRNSFKWQKVRDRVKDRDHYLCRLCLPGDGYKRLNNENLEVHHIVPIEQDESLAFDESNLITLCRQHHEEAEAAGEAMRETLRALAATPLTL